MAASMIDTLIEQCRRRNLRVIVLWFGAIKNGGLHYAPSWVIKDRARYPSGKETFAVSPFCEAAWQADIRAFTRLMERIKDEQNFYRLGKVTVLLALTIGQKDQD